VGNDVLDDVIGWQDGCITALDQTALPHRLSIIRLSTVDELVDAIRALRDRGALAHVIADETRPLLQGSRLTAWELDQLGIEHYLVADGAGPFLISQGHADAVVVGADRVAANGDVANKIGTYSLALAARRAGIPFVVVAPRVHDRRRDRQRGRHPARAAPR